jgi:CheY-like chemotaxis protein
VESLKESILVAEDEVKIARLLEIELEFEGYNVTKAIEGPQALDLYSSSWDLIILDIMLPGISGIEVSPQIPQ